MAVLRPQGGQFRALSEAPLEGIAAKFAQPRVPPNFVVRAHLNALLDQGTKRPLTVVSAGAGWGKTLATTAWASSAPEAGPVAWISLDASDNEPRTFWTCFVSAVQGALDVPPGNPMAELAPGLGSETAGLQRLLAGIEQLPEPVVVVLDDFHVIDEPTVIEGIGTLLQHPLEQLRLVIVTRFDPALPLHRLRMSDQVYEIRSRDLAFDESDAAAMLAADDLEVAPADVRLLLRRTEGWPAGMRLASLFLKRDPTRDPASFAGDDQAVTDYLVGEVLASQPAEMQQFLLRTSVAERLSSGLAEALTDASHGQQRLEALESSNAFVVGLGPGREWFRYHALLREVLRHRLGVEDPRALPDLHRRAAHWFAANGLPIEAMRHAADAQDWHLLGRIFVTSAAALVVSADRTAVERVLHRIPRDRLDDGPDLLVCAAARLYLAGRFEDMEPHLERAQDELRRRGQQAHSGTQVTCLLLSMAVLRSRGDVEGVRRAAITALDELSGPGLSLPSASEYRSVALGNLGTALLWMGRLDEAEHQLTEGLAAAAGSRLDVSRINMLGHLALVATANGRLGAAFDYATEAIALVEARGWAPLAQAATAYLALASVHHRRNDLPTARRLLEQGEVAAVGEATARRAIALAGAWMDASAGRLPAARARLHALTTDLDGAQLPAFLASLSAFAVAQIDLAAGDPEPATHLVERARQSERLTDAEVVRAARALLVRGEPRQAEELLRPLRDNDSGVAVDAWLLTALAADRLREDNRATEAMGRAVELAATEGVRRPFLELYPGHVGRLLGLVRQLDPGVAGFVEELLGELRPHLSGPGRTESLSETLTERELIVLRFLPTMMTNAEIAEELFVSVNTVKAHLKRIYRKLDVVSRREAVHRARELGLLSDTAV